MRFIRHLALALLAFRACTPLPAAQYAITVYEENASGGLTPRTVTLTSGQALVAGVSGQVAATDVATQAELTSATSGLLSSVPAGRTVVMDAANGNDGTGTRARLDKPFATPTAAKAAAQSGDVVLVLPGAYTTTASLAKAGVNWRFLPGASVAWATTSAGGIWDDGGSSMTFRVEGGTFTKTQDESDNALIHVTGATSDITVTGATLAITATGNANQSCLYQQSGTVLLRDCVLTSDYDGIITNAGVERLRVERCTITAGDSCVEGGADDVRLIDCDLTATGDAAATDGVTGDLWLEGCRTTTTTTANGHNQEVGMLTLVSCTTTAAGSYALQSGIGLMICLQGSNLEAAGSGGSIVQGAPTLKILGTVTGNGTYGSAELDGGTWLNIASGTTTATGTLTGWTFNGALGTSLSLVDAADFRAKAGLTIGTHVQAYDADLAAISLLTTTSYGRSLLELADAAALRTAGGLVIGTDVQAYDADLADLADGTLTGSKVGSGIDAGNITAGTLDATRLGTGTIGATQLASSGVTAGSYRMVNVTVDADGRVTAISSAMEPVGFACSDETTALTTGTAKVTYKAPYAFTITGVFASVTTAPTGATLIVDVNVGGTSALSTKLSIDAGETGSDTAATAAVIDTAHDDVAAFGAVTIDIDQIGSSTAGAGLKVWIYGTPQ